MDYRKEHKWIDLANNGGPLVCQRCGRSALWHYAIEFPCSQGEAPVPGGLDKLELVKELTEVKSLLCTTMDDYDEPRGAVSLMEAVGRLRQLISKLEGQDTEKPAASELEGSAVAKRYPMSHMCAYEDFYCQGPCVHCGRLKASR